MSKMWKSQSGYTGIDVAISIVILLIFTALISTIFVNIYIQYSEAQRNSIASSYIAYISESVDKMYYQDVSNENITSIINDMNISSGYTVTATVVKYQPEGNNSMDLVKTVKINVSYKVGNTTKNLSVDRIKAKEILITPNRPKVSDGMVPVKYVVTDIMSGTGYWQITSENDSTWYNYDNKVWAKIMLTENLTAEGNISVTDENKSKLVGKKITNISQIFEWIPRYATSGNNLRFLYSTSDKYVNNERNLETLETGYTVPEAFGVKTGFWIAKRDYETINTQFERSVALMSISEEQKQAALVLSESNYGEHASEYINISNNRYVIMQ